MKHLPWVIAGGAAAGYLAGTGRSGRGGQRAENVKVRAKGGQTVEGPWGTKTMQVSRITESPPASVFLRDHHQIGHARYQNESWQVSRKVPEADRWSRESYDEIPWKASFDKSFEQRMTEMMGDEYVKPTRQRKESVLPAHLRPEFDRFVLSVLGRTKFIPHREVDYSRYHWDPKATKEVWNPPTAGDIAKWIFAFSSPRGGKHYSSELAQSVTDPGWQVSQELYDVLIPSAQQVWFDNAYLRRQWTTQVRSALTRLKKQGKVFTMTGYRKGKEIKEWALKEYE